MKALLLPLPFLLSSCHGRLSDAAEFVGVVLLFVLAICLVFLIFGGGPDAPEDSSPPPPRPSIGFGPREEMEMQVSFERAAVAQCSEGLAEVMHDAYQCAGHLEPSQIVLWRGKKRSPECLDECNAWRAAASAAIRTLA